MSLTRARIVAELTELLGQEQVDTDPGRLAAASVDRFRKYEEIFGVYTRPIPAAVVHARSTADVAAVLEWADRNRVPVVPRTGGSATEGGLETALPDSIVLDGSRMDRIVSIDVPNMQATVQCGVGLQRLDDELATLGLTTGHSPQSKPLAQLGGLVATRSIGQLSTLYGGIEDMVVGLEAVFPGGRVARIKNVPRRAAGPDIRHMVIGSEGALCFVTEVTVKLFTDHSAGRRYLGYVLESMRDGVQILREVMVAGYRPSVARLYDPADGAGHFSHFAAGECVLIFGVEGPEPVAAATEEGIAQLVADRGDCEQVDGELIRRWFAALNWGPEQIAAEREEIRRTRSIGFTTEISAGWSQIADIHEAVVRRVGAEIEGLELIGGHSSHSYINGTNLYFVYGYQVGDTPPEQEISRFHQPINAIICEETLARGGSIVHHHGIGKARTPWVREEYGSSYPVLRALKDAFDPHGVMNPGTIWPLDG